MPRFSLSPKFIKETIWVLRKKPLKHILFGNQAEFSSVEATLEHRLATDFPSFQQSGARRGQWQKGEPLHKGSGTVYLIPNQLGDPQKESLLVFSANAVITSGPDLYVYLSRSTDPRKNLGAYIDLGDLKGSKGGQTYVVPHDLASLDQYKTVIIYCKQFSVLFTYALLK